jgi:hypothetical protein
MSALVSRPDADLRKAGPLLNRATVAILANDKGRLLLELGGVGGAWDAERREELRRV